MPKIISEQDSKVIKHLRRVAMNEGLGIRCQLTEPLGNLPAGTWLFGKIKVQPSEMSQVIVEYEGTSNPPKRK